MRFMKQIQSSLRGKWNRQASIDLFIKTYGPETAALFGLKKVPSDSDNRTLTLSKSKNKPKVLL